MKIPLAIGLCILATGALTARAQECLDYQDYIRWRGSVATPGRAHNIAYQNGIAYVADRDEGLQIIDNTDPDNPRIIANLPTSTFAYAVAVDGSLACLGIPLDAVLIVDVSDPAQPAELGTLSLPSDCEKLRLRGNYLYVSNDDSLLVADLSNPASPAIVGTLAFPNQLNELDVQGDYLYATSDYNQEFYAIDVSDPAAPFLAGSTGLAWPGRGLDVSGDYAYVVTQQGLEIVQTSDPAHPISLAIASYLDPYSSCQYVAVAGNHAYVQQWLPEPLIQVVDVGDPLDPATISTLAAANVTITGMVAEGDIVTVAEAGTTSTNPTFGIRSFDVAHPEAAPLLGSAISGSSHDDIYLRGNFAFLSAWLGLCVFDVSSPDVPFAVATVSGGGQWGVDGRGDYLYGTTVYWLRITDISDPLNPRTVGTLNQAGLWKIAAGDQVVYATSKSKQFYVIDVSDPVAPSVLAVAAMPDTTTQLDVVGDYAYVLDNAKGMHVIDVSVPAAPVIVGSYHSPYFLTDIAVDGDRAYLCGSTGHCEALDISDPSNPQPIADLGLEQAGNRITVADGFAYISSDNCVAVLRVGESGAPVRWGSLTGIENYFQGIAVRDGLLYIAGRYYLGTALQIAHAQCPVLTAVPDDAPALELPHLLAHPNPFNPQTLLTCQLAQETRVELSIHDLSGRCVASLHSGPLPAGKHEFTWRGEDEQGRPQASGVYLARLATPEFVSAGKLILLK